MKLASMIIAGALAGALGVMSTAAHAENHVPAEFPPSTFEGKQYVDSRGCVFIRAGIDGTVTWVPRVTSARKKICGFQPTLHHAVADVATVPRPAEVPVMLTDITASPSNSAPRVVRRPEAAAPRRQALVETTGRPAKVPAPAPAAHTASHAPDQITGHTRILPKHVARNRINTSDGVRVPPGYRKVWEDGRLNSRRTEQTLAGRRDMLLIWTQTVPRRLVDTRTGRDVTASVPLVYPYLDVATQRRELGEVKIVTRDGIVAKRIQPKRKPIFSSRSQKSATQPQEVARATAAGRYVQVGTYRNPANAHATAQRVAQMGLPARIAKQRQGGTTYLTVSAGPFSQSDVVRTALHRLRGAGYADAFARR